jgi:hypothetical protein
MANRDSLLAGRNSRPLSADDVRRVYNTFLGLDPSLPVRYVAGARTVFRVPATGEEGGDCEVTFGEDIYPGTSVVDPNSALSMEAAVAHEITHYCRWKDKTEIPSQDLEEIDEALTSLDAILRFPRQLNEHATRQLVADAIQRLQLYIHRCDQERVQTPSPVSDA